MVRFALVLSALFPAWTAEWMVAPGAAPGGDGSPAAPFATIAQGLAVAQPGDTVRLRGGVHRGQVWFPRSGTTGRPITLAAWSPDGTPERRERPVITTAEIIVPGQGGAGAWESLGDGLWRIALPAAFSATSQRGALFVTLDDRPLQDARWPDTDRHPDFDKARAAEASAGRVVADDLGGDPAVDAGEYTVPALATAGFPDGALIGARMQFNPGRQWGVTAGRVTGVAGDRLAFTWNRNAGGVANAGTLDPMPRDWLILWDALALLDRPDEQWVDHDGRSGPAGMLYLRSATPPTQRRLAVGRNNLAGLGGRSHIALVGLDLLGVSLWTDAATSDILIEGVTSRYAGAGIGANGVGMQVRGRRVTVRDSDISDCGGSGIFVADGRDLAIEDVAIRRVKFSGIQTLASATAVRVAATTVWDTGSHGVSFLSFASEFTGMHVYKAGRMASDIALINAFGSPGAPLGTAVHHNWVHSPAASRDRTRYRWEGCNGIRTDSGGNGILGVAGVDIHHNLIWGEGLRNGIQVFALRPGQTGFGAAAIRIAHNTVLASGDEAASINLVGDAAAGASARGFEVVNNLAGGYQCPTAIRDAAPPDAVRANLFTNARAVRGLPADGANQLLADPRLSAAPVRDGIPDAGSPLVDAGTVHALSGTWTGGAPDIGAVERGMAPWMAGARVGRRHVPALRLRGELAADGRRSAVLDDLPPGRLMPVGTTVEVDGLVLADGAWAYDALTDRGSLRFPLAGAVPRDGAVVRVDLDGPGGPVPPIALAAPAEGFAGRIDAATWDAATGTLTITGAGLGGATEERRPLALVDAAGGDLRQRPVLYRITSGAGGPGRLALIADQGGETAPMPASVEQVRDGLVQGWTVLPDAWGLRFGPGAAVRLWAADRADGGPRDHAAAAVPGSGTGAPEQVQWPSLGSPERLVRVAPERAAVDPDGRVGALADPWSVVSASAAGARRPLWTPTALAGLPALRFDGLQGLVHPGVAASGPVAVATVYRNQEPGGPAPGGSPQQRLVRSGTTNAGVFLSMLLTASGAVAPAPVPTLRGFQDAATILRPRAPFRIGHDERAGALSDGLVGWMGETLFFAVVEDGTAWPDAADYLATKYRIHPAGRLLDGSGPVLAPVRIRYAGVELVPVAVAADRIVAVLPEGVAPPAPRGGADVVHAGGTATAAVAVVGDATPPPVPPAPAAAPAGDPRPTLTGSAEPLARIRILRDGTMAGTVTADAAGAWVWRPADPLPVGAWTFRVDAEDGSGNRSALSAATVHTVYAPPAVGIPAAFPPVLALP